MRTQILADRFSVYVKVLGQLLRNGPAFDPIMHLLENRSQVFEGIDAAFRRSHIELFTCAIGKPMKIGPSAVEELQVRVRPEIPNVFVRIEFTRDTQHLHPESLGEYSANVLLRGTLASGIRIEIKND